MTIHTTDIATDETFAQRARRMGKEYAIKFHGKWASAGRKAIQFAYARGYEAACKDINDAADELRQALDHWEVDGNDEQLVNDAVDPFLASLNERAGA